MRVFIYKLTLENKENKVFIKNYVPPITIILIFYIKTLKCAQMITFSFTQLQKDHFYGHLPNNRTQVASQQHAE